MFDTNKYHTLTLFIKYCPQKKGNEKKKRELSGTELQKLQLSRSLDYE